MKLTNPTEHAIYAAAFVRGLEHEAKAGLPPPGPEHDERLEQFAVTASTAAEHCVLLHRAAMRRRRSAS